MGQAKKHGQLQKLSSTRIQFQNLIIIIFVMCFSFNIQQVVSHHLSISVLDTAYQYKLEMRFVLQEVMIRNTETTGDALLQSVTSCTVTQHRICVILRYIPPHDMQGACFVQKKLPCCWITKIENFSLRK